MKPFQPPNAKYAEACKIITNSEDHNSALGPLHFQVGDRITACGLNIETESVLGHPIACTQIYLYNPESKYYSAEPGDIEKLCKICVHRLDDL